MRYFTANAVVGNQEFEVAEQGLSELFGSTRLLTINYYYIYMFAHPQR